MIERSVCASPGVSHAVALRTASPRNGPRRWPLLVAALLASTAASAMRCGSRLVGEGDRDFQVRERCGAPFWVDAYAGVDVLGARTPLERQVEVRFEAWYFNFGPRDLMRRLIFRDGVLQGEETLGYGVRDLGADCPMPAAWQGLSSGELVARCGEPVSRRSRPVTIVRRPGPRHEQWREQRDEAWLYDGADAGFVYEARLVDGRVVGIERLTR